MGGVLRTHGTSVLTLPGRPAHLRPCERGVGPLSRDRDGRGHGVPHRPCPPRGGQGLTELRPLIPRASFDHVKLVVEREVPGSDLSQHYIREGTGAERGSPAAALAAGLREQAGDPDSYLARSVSGVALEYDLAGLAPGRSSPPPGVFLTPKGRPPVRGAFSSGTRDPAGLFAALAAVVGWNGRRRRGRPHGGEGVCRHGSEPRGNCGSVMGRLSGSLDPAGVEQVRAG